jgi:hypothetical protein
MIDKIKLTNQAGDTEYKLIPDDGSHQYAVNKKGRMIATLEGGSGIPVPDKRGITWTSDSECISFTGFEKGVPYSTTINEDGSCPVSFSSKEATSGNITARMDDYPGANFSVSVTFSGATQSLTITPEQSRTVPADGLTPYTAQATLVLPDQSVSNKDITFSLPATGSAFFLPQEKISPNKREVTVQTNANGITPSIQFVDTISQGQVIHLNATYASSLNAVPVDFIFVEPLGSINLTPDTAQLVIADGKQEHTAIATLSNQYAGTKVQFNLPLDKMATFDTVNTDYAVSNNARTLATTTTNQGLPQVLFIDGNALGETVTLSVFAENAKPQTHDFDFSAPFTLTLDAQHILALADGQSTLSTRACLTGPSGATSGKVITFKISNGSAFFVAAPGVIMVGIDKKTATAQTDGSGNTPSLRFFDACEAGESIIITASYGSYAEAEKDYTFDTYNDFVIFNCQNNRHGCMSYQVRLVLNGKFENNITIYNSADGALLGSPSGCMSGGDLLVCTDVNGITETISVICSEGWESGPEWNSPTVTAWYGNLKASYTFV